MLDEQQFHDLEQRHLSLKKEYDSVCAERDSFRGRCTSFQEELSEVRDQLLQDEKKISELTWNLKEKEISLKDLQVAQEDTNDKYRRRSEECDRLREDMKTQSVELVALQSRCKELQISLSEIQSKQLPIELELTKALREKEVAESKAGFLEGEMRKIEMERTEGRAESIQKLKALEHQVATLKAEAAEHAKHAQAMKDHEAVQSEKIESYLHKLREAEEKLVANQASFAQELDGVKKLLALYKQHFEEAIAKVEEQDQQATLMRDSHAANLSKMKDNCIAQLEKHEALWGEEKQRLLQEMSQLQQRLNEAEQSLSSHPGANVVGADSVSALSSADGLLGMTDMYDRVVHLERDLLQEKARNKELELYMSQILKDIENKAPLIASQRRDYHRLVESHTKLTQKLDHFVIENNEMRAVIKDLQTRANQATEEARNLEVHNSDLCKQLQHILKQSMNEKLSGTTRMVATVGEEEDAGEVVTNFLLTYDDIAQLQEQNAQLLKVVRKLSEDQSKVLITDVSAATSDANKEALEAAIVELSNMREDRKRTEQLVGAITQQRDLYRAMLEEMDSMHGTDALQRLGDASALNTSAATTATAVSSSKISELQWQVRQAEEEKKRLQERINRMADVEKALNESLDKVRHDATAARMEAAQHSAEARFQRERSERLEVSLKTAQMENTSAAQRRLDAEKILFDAQQMIKERDERIALLNETIRAAQSSQRKAEIDCEVAKASESRIIQQLNEAKDEVKRHSALLEHIQRIESGLKSRIEDEREALQQERDNLLKSNESLRKQFDERSMVEEQRLKAIEDDSKSANQKLQLKVQELARLNEDFIRSQCSLKAAQEGSELLEKQLQVAQARLGSIHGIQVLETVAASELSSKELALERAQAEIDALKQQVAAAENHAEQFRKISVANEAAMKELQQRSQEGRAQLDSDLRAKDSEMARMQQELSDQRERVLALIRELEASGDALKATCTAHEAETSALKETLSIANHDVANLQAQLKAVGAEVARFQDASRVSYENYERELQLHAQAEKDRREKQTEVDKLTQLLAVAQNQVADISAECIRKEKAVSEERAAAKDELERLHEQLSNLQSANDLLHGQVQSYGIQIERLQMAKVSGDTAESQGQEVTEETSDLRKANSELREVLRFVKRDKDLMQAKLSVVEIENNRLSQELLAARRILDETKLELRQELEKRTAVRSEEEFQKLVLEVSQLNLLRESNAHLRFEMEELSKRNASLGSELKALKEHTVPLEDALRKVQADKDSLELINDQLGNDVAYWKDRLQKLVSRYNDVDPEEHRLLKVSLEEAQKALAETRLQLVAQEEAGKAAVEAKAAELNAVIAAKTTEMSALNTNSKNQEQNAEKLRARLRAFMKEKQDMETAAKAAAEDIVGKNAQIESLSKQVTENQTQITALNTTINSLQAAATAVEAATRAVRTPGPKAVPPQGVSAAAEATPGEPVVRTPSTSGVKKRNIEAMQAEGQTTQGESEPAIAVTTVVPAEAVPGALAESQPAEPVVDEATRVATLRQQQAKVKAQLKAAQAAQAKASSGAGPSGAPGGAPQPKRARPTPGIAPVVQAQPAAAVEKVDEVAEPAMEVSEAPACLPAAVVSIPPVAPAPSPSIAVEEMITQDVAATQDVAVEAASPSKAVEVSEEVAEVTEQATKGGTGNPFASAPGGPPTGGFGAQFGGAPSIFGNFGIAPSEGAGIFSAKPPAAGASIFGKPFGQQSAATSIFGQPAPAGGSSLFGAAGTGGGGPLFGTKAAAGSGGIFGGPLNPAAPSFQPKQTAGEEAAGDEEAKTKLEQRSLRFGTAPAVTGKRPPPPTAATPSTVPGQQPGQKRRPSKGAAAHAAMAAQQAAVASAPVDEEGGQADAVGEAEEGLEDVTAEG